MLRKNILFQLFVAGLMGMGIKCRDWKADCSQLMMQVIKVCSIQHSRKTRPPLPSSLTLSKTLTNANFNLFGTKKDLYGDL